jgi:hypothetical protein
MSYLGPRKLYIDSRYRSSGTHSDFVFQLAQSVEVPAGMVAIIDTVSVPNIFMTVDASRDKLYLQLFGANPRDVVLTLTHGMYNGVTLANELQAQLLALGIGDFTVVYGTATGQLNLTYTNPADPSTFRIRGRTVAYPYDALEVLGLDLEGRFVYEGEADTFPNHVDIAGTRVLYLCSGNFGHYSALGPRGESDILRAVYVDAANGSYIVDRIANPFEFIECAGQQLQSLRFSLRDGNGRTVDMRGRSIAFSIIFLQK